MELIDTCSFRILTVPGILFPKNIFMRGINLQLNQCLANSLHLFRTLSLRWNQRSITKYCRATLKICWSSNFFIVTFRSRVGNVHVHYTTYFRAPVAILQQAIIQISLRKINHNLSLIERFSCRWFLGKNGLLFAKYFGKLNINLKKAQIVISFVWETSKCLRVQN